MSGSRTLMAMMCAVPNASGNEVMVDMEQQLTPFFWPPFLPPLKLWLHVILYLRDSADGCARWQTVRCGMLFPIY